jgi:mannose-6-phosphate isomerase-like protein (cupin superfamily)
MESKMIMSPELSESVRSYILEVSVDVGEDLGVHSYPEERLYYFTDGRGIMSVYEEFPKGDVYEIRQDTAVWLTPKIEHHIFNTGNSPLRYVVLMVTGGIAPDGELSWTAITKGGAEMEKPQVGAGQATIRVMDEHSNPSHEEGLHLRIRGIKLRRPQKFSNAEILTMQPGGGTRPHTHHDTEENYYILVGEGVFKWDDRVIPCKTGDCLSFPVGVRRNVVNTGKYPLTYLCFSAFID